MSAGLQVFNDYGVRQIDQDYFNFGLTYKGTATLNSTAFGSTTVGEAAISVTGTTPVLAINCAYDTVIWYSSQSGSTFTYYVISKTGIGQSLTYYVFDYQNQAAVADHFGLEVFNASGTRVYHSSCRPMNVVGFYNGLGTFSLTAGRTYAIIQSNYNFIWSSTPFSGSYRNLSHFSTAKITSTPSLVVASTIFESYSGSAGTNVNEGGASNLVVDVTNY